MRIAVIDAETDPFKRHRVPKPFIWGFYDGSMYQQFADTEKLIEFLKEQDCICYAHNGGRFDWHFLLHAVEPYDDVMLINGRIAKMRLGLCECRDSYNIIPVPLAAYKKDDIDYAIMEADERDKPQNKRLIEAYLKSDCVYLWELVTKFIDEYGVQLTQAGAAMQQWKKLSTQPVPRTDAVFYHAIAPYYYGGRVECFKSGILEGNYSVFDINSAYPYAMLEKHPYSDNFGVDNGYSVSGDFFRVRCVSRGAFPFRGAVRGGLSFPCDDEVREYTVTKWEYDVALETGTIEDVEVLETLTFMGHTDMSVYVNHFYEKRNECKARGDDAGSLFAKLLMNSLYGKFSANPENYKNYMVVPMEVIEGLPATGWSFSGEFGPWALAAADIAEERQRFYNVATGASITGYVRAMLWRAICASDGVVYCDTDSITCKRGKVKLGDKLGQWKHEGNFDRLGIAGKKMYIMRGVKGEDGKREYKVAHKGVKLTHSQLWAVAKGGMVEYVPEAPTFSPKKVPVFTNRKVRFTA